MKRPGLIPSLLLIVFITAILGCSQDGTTSTAPSSSGNQASVPTIEGSTFDAPGFTIVVPKGWESVKVDGGVQMYKGNDIVQVYIRGFNMTAGEDKGQTESNAKRYNGTPPEQIDIFGMKFWKTTYTAASVYQTSYLSMKNGQLVSVQIAGADHDKNDTIKGILNTLKFK